MPCACDLQCGFLNACGDQSLRLFLCCPFPVPRRAGSVRFECGQFLLRENCCQKLPPIRSGHGKELVFAMLMLESDLPGGVAVKELRSGFQIRYQLDAEVPAFVNQIIEHLLMRFLHPDDFPVSVHGTFLCRLPFPRRHRRSADGDLTFDVLFGLCDQHPSQTRQIQTFHPRRHHQPVDRFRRFPDHSRRIHAQLNHDSPPGGKSGARLTSPFSAVHRSYSSSV